MAYMAKDGPDITQKVLGDEAFNNKWGCKNNIEPDGTKGPHREWRFGKCRDCGMGEGKYTQAFQEWQGGGTVTGDRRSRGRPSEEVVSTEPVLVQVRIRPLNAIERARAATTGCVHCADDGCTIQFVSAARGRGGGTAEQAPVQQLTFDATLHGPSQASVFRSVGATKLLEDALNGYAVTVFAYGQTGSGKTYTMSGADPDGGSPPTTASYTGADDGPEGLIPRALGALFALIGRAQAGGAPPTSVRASYLELYNEQINDLLNPASTNLNLRWNASAGAFVQDLLQVECENVGDAQLVFEEGTRNRKVGSHSMNKDSSRSHCIMTIHIGSAQTGRMGKLSFVDLAGSERLVETRHNTSGSKLGAWGIKEARPHQQVALHAVSRDLGALGPEEEGRPHPVPRLEADAAPHRLARRRRPHDDARVHLAVEPPPRGDDQHAALRVAREEHHQPPGGAGRHPRRAPLADAAVAPPAPRGEPDAQDAPRRRALLRGDAGDGRRAADRQRRQRRLARLLGRDDVD